MNIDAVSEPMPPGGGSMEGRSPLAGHLGLPSLLVRETVQNAWDARDDQRVGPVHFSIDGFDLDTDELDHLRDLLPVKRLKGFDRRSRDDEARGILHPSAVLKQSHVRVLVISDRGTVGLCGPSRSGEAWDPVRHGADLERGQQRFANFVRNQGRAAMHSGAGDGGAFGVGKSVLWMASACGTILIHSRTTDKKGKPVERFIGAIHGDYFQDKRSAYTGRHFVGIKSNDGIIEPLTGRDAARARRDLPIPTYEVDGAQVDGTSIVIVAPRLSLDWKTEMDRIRDAIRWHVWPKRVPGVRDPEGGPDMHFDLRWNNNRVDIPAPLDDPELKPYAKALLDSARGRIDPDPARDHTAECRRPIKVLGTVKFRQAGIADQNAFHITLTNDELDERSRAAGIEDADDEAAIDFPQPWGQIALIRREPLLLVKYEPIGGPEAAANDVGVFLSAEDPEVEEALTRAEPPAHDEWNHRNVPKDHPQDHRRTYAKRAVEEIAAARKRLIATYRSGDQGTLGGGEQAVSQRISEGLFGGLGGAGRPKQPRPSGGGKPKAPRAALRHVRTSRDGDRTMHELSVAVEGLNVEADIVLTAGGDGYDSSGSMKVGERASFRWADESGAATSGPSIRTQWTKGIGLSLFISVDSDLRFRPKVDVEVEDTHGA